MLRSRLSVFLMIHKGNLYKSENFRDYTYIGDPINAVRIFNDFDVDELFIFDIDASKLMTDPKFDLIEHIASESRSPLCYGGGINNLFQVEKIINLGVEKISLSSQAINNPSIVKSVSNLIGSQSTVCCLDVRKLEDNTYSAFTINGTNKINLEVTRIIDSFIENGVGEIIINNIDRDGTMLGLDEELIKLITENFDLPMTFIGGAKDLENIARVLEQYGLIGIAGGRIFSLIGRRKSVLLNYPSRDNKRKYLLTLSDTN